MKKTLIALAAVAVAGAASAEVSIGGRLDFGYSNSKATVGDVVTKSTTLAGRDSGATSDRLTFKGNEDLGGGLKASFEYTMNLQPDAGDAAFGTNRESFIALSSDMGTVKLGTFTNVFDGFVQQGWHNATGTGVGLFPGRTDNAVSYTAPAFGPITAGIAIASDKTTEANAVTAKNNSTLLFGSYADGPLSIDVGYGDAKVSTATLAAWAGADGVDVMADTAGGIGVKQLGIKAAYDFGVATGQYMYVDAKLTESGETAKFNEHELSVKVPMGAVNLSGAYNTTKGKNLLDGVKYSAYSMSADYVLSKRTTAYVTFGNKTLKADGVTAAKSTATAIGIYHLF